MSRTFDRRNQNGNFNDSLEHTGYSTLESKLRNRQFEAVVNGSNGNNEKVVPKAA